ncbi:unnamed protein product [Spirodela intermedia]|uniref:ATP synthase alpha subunit C-terminal domain-containing protein n=1 Tax=Spirodela intermedia TaxID=51605 RepID=A0A7I8L5D6_SPIIN|nr:unnamed protein product [Spirodela intermedia]
MCNNYFTYISVMLKLLLKLPLEDEIYISSGDPMKQLARKFKPKLTQFSELEAFAQFATDLNKATHKQSERGQRLIQMLKQSKSASLGVEEQVPTILLLEMDSLII